MVFWNIIVLFSESWRSKSRSMSKCSMWFCFSRSTSFKTYIRNSVWDVIRAKGLNGRVYSSLWAESVAFNAVFVSDQYYVSLYYISHLSCECLDKIRQTSCWIRISDTHFKCVCAIFKFVQYLSGWNDHFTDLETQILRSFVSFITQIELMFLNLLLQNIFISVGIVLSSALNLWSCWRHYNEKSITYQLVVEKVVLQRSWR